MFKTFKRAMLSAWALTALFASGAAAVERSIYDLLYLPGAGTTFGSTEGSYITGELESEDNLTNRFDGTRLQQTLGHSVTDRFLLWASVAHTKLDYHTRYDDDDFGTFKSKTTFKGLGDPTLLGRYRILDEAFQLDVVGGWTFDTGDAESKGNRFNVKGQHDQFFEGGEQWHAGLEAALVSAAFQVAGSFRYSRVLESTGKYNGESVKDDAHDVYLFQGQVLAHLAEPSLLRGSLSLRFIESYGDSDSRSSPITEYKLGGEYQHLISRDVLARAGIEYRQLNIDRGQFSEWYQVVYGLGIDYQF